jgi:mannobiose 2-epimerase
MEKMLNENIVPFWLTKSLDKINGGYTINHNQKGEVKPGGVKVIVTQARTVWLFSRTFRAGYGDNRHLEAANHGYRFLVEKMWDSEYGGFYWQVDSTGVHKQRPGKHLYGQAFALYALSELYLASENDEVLEFATKLFHLLETKAHDDIYGGYLESFNRDWSPVSSDQTSYMNVNGDLKLMNTHLHLMEALTTFYRASKLPLARDRLLELIRIQSNTVVRKQIGACTDKYKRDWTPLLGGRFSTVSYGHDIENVWLLMDACKAVGQPIWPLMDLCRTLYEYSLKHGYDKDQGGFFYTGPFNQPANNRNKNWWVQAEAVVSALYMYQLTNDQKYLSVFEKTYSFIEKHMADWEFGEWHSNIGTDGAVKPGYKAQPWKSGYHNGRAMIESIQILKQMHQVSNSRN